MNPLAQEVAEKKIRGIAPGVIKTNTNKETWSAPARAKEDLKLAPYDRLGEPADMARAVVWFASHESDCVTGTALFEDGGMAPYPAFREGG